MNWDLQLPQRQKNKKIMRYPFGEELNGYFYLYKNIAYVILVEN